MSPTAFEYRHPNDGYIRLERMLGTVKLRCRWPFDLSQDDWISISNEFDAEAYSAAIVELERTGEGQVAGIVGGTLKVARKGERISLDFSNESVGWMHKSLQLLLDVQPFDLHLI